MAAVTVRNIPDDVHRALRARAVQHGRSTEAEIREILRASVEEESGLGDRLAAIGRRGEPFDLVLLREQAEAEPAVFE